MNSRSCMNSRGYPWVCTFGGTKPAGPYAAGANAGRQGLLNAYTSYIHMFPPMNSLVLKTNEFYTHPGFPPGRLTRCLARSLARSILPASPSFNEAAFLEECCMFPSSFLFASFGGVSLLLRSANELSFSYELSRLPLGVYFLVGRRT